MGLLPPTLCTRAAEGIIALQDPRLRDLYDLKLFMRCDSDLMLAQWLKRDVTERGQSVDSIFEECITVYPRRDGLGR
ncbi:hypothetical protein DFH09DRAFT_1309321 [Mycena vulgaris]|nr:hypothetical protein DFH09DRAFT_1309321 [Mycena vulgaris]